MDDDVWFLSCEKKMYHLTSVTHIDEQQQQQQQQRETQEAKRQTRRRSITDFV